MTPKRYGMVIICTMLAAWLALPPAWAAEGESFPVTPNLNHGQKWRMGYLEGGPWYTYPQNVKATVSWLMELGWIEKANIPLAPNDDDARKLWLWMAENLKSDYIQFVPDAFWSGNWDVAIREENRRRMIRRFNRQKDIDLMLGAGTRAGLDLAQNDHHVASVILDASDPVASGIVKSVADSGLDHVHARCDPGRYKRQIRLFHRIVNFDKLGLPYQNDAAGRSYAAVDDVETVAGEAGFEVVPCDLPYLGDYSPKIDLANGMACIESLGKQGVRAVYLTEHTALDIKNIGNLVALMIQYRMCSFAQSSSEFVKQGVLMSISQAGYRYVGKFYAQTIAKIFNHALPRQLPQVFQSPDRIAINMKTAAAIGFEFPTAALQLSDEYY